MKDKLKRWISLFLICVFCFSSTVAAAAVEDGTAEEQKREQRAEEILKMDEKVGNILQKVGVGLAEESDMESEGS